MIALPANGLLLLLSHHKYSHSHLWVTVCRKKSACGRWDVLNRASTCPKNHRNVIFPEKKRLRQWITHTQGIKIPGTSFFPKKKAPAAVHHTHTGHKNIRNPGTADITNVSGYFCDVMPWPLIGFGMDLWSACPSQNHNIFTYPAIFHDVIHGL